MKYGSYTNEFHYYEHPNSDFSNCTIIKYFQIYVYRASTNLHALRFTIVKFMVFLVTQCHEPMKFTIICQILQLESQFCRILFKTNINLYLLFSIGSNTLIVIYYISII